MRPVEQKHLCNEKDLCKKLRATAKSVTQKKTPMMVSTLR